MSGVQFASPESHPSESVLASMPEIPPIEDSAPEETVEETVTLSEGEPERKRRRFRPEEILLAKRFEALAEPGTLIPFASLETELKRAVLPNRQNRLVDRGLVEVDYDEDTGFLKAVRIVPEMLEVYKWDLTLPVAKVISGRTTLTGEVRQRRPRNLLADSKYQIKLATVEGNPKRPGSHAWFNWQECYRDGMSIPAYLSQDYNRMLKTSRGAWFNGPASIYLEHDLKAGLIGIYDSTLATDDPAFWVKPEDLTRLANETPYDDSEADTPEDEIAENGTSDQA